MIKWGTRGREGSFPPKSKNGGVCDHPRNRRGCHNNKIGRSLKGVSEMRRRLFALIPVLVHCSPAHGFGYSSSFSASTKVVGL